MNQTCRGAFAASYYSQVSHTGDANGVRQHVTGHLKLPRAIQYTHTHKENKDTVHPVAQQMTLLRTQKLVMHCVQRAYSRSFSSAQRRQLTKR